MRHFTSQSLLILFMLILPAEFIQANERRFGFTYESSVLPAGVREIELWTTDRRGRGYFYHRLDQRIEFEFGVTDNLMSAFYLNSTSRTKDDNGDALGGMNASSIEVSISNEWKYKLMDRTADQFGCAIYGEFTLATDMYGLESKLIFDKQIQHILVAADITGEYEASSDIKNGIEEIETEVSLKPGIAAAYVADNGFGAGMELRSNNIFISGSLQHASLFAGPTISYASEAMWFTISFMPQIHSFAGGTTASKDLDLGEFEKFQTRLLLSFRL
ncbi:MAG: hypothetical protein ACOYNS_00060 [Bacteroidota bacterium]